MNFASNSGMEIFFLNIKKKYITIENFFKVESKGKN